jgi:hypothetical protein
LNIFSKLAQAALGQSDDQGTPLQDIETASDQTPEEISLVSHVREKIDQVRQSSARVTQEGVCFTNTAYLLGYDGVMYDTNARQFKNIDPKRKLTRNRFKINKVLPTIQNRLARLTQNAPKFDVRPNSNSSEDKDCARLGLEILESVFEKQRFVEKQQELLMCTMQGGVAYIQPLWDPTLGEPMVDPDSGEVVGYEGDIRLEVYNMLEVFPDPLAKSLDDAQWVVKAKVRKLDYFKEHYPQRGHAVKEEDVWLLSSIYDLRANGMSTAASPSSSTSAQMKNSAIELVYYEKRSKKYPNGRMVVCASGILLEDKELPIGEFDLIKFDDIIVGGRYNAESIITHLRPVQDQYNILRSKCADWVRQTLGGKYLAAKGAGLSQEALNNVSGEVVEYNAVPNAGPPQAMSIPQIPQYVYEDIKTLNDEFDFISGINEVSRGTTESSSMPYRLGALLQEQDQTRLSVQTNRNEIGYAKLGSAILKYVGKYYKMPRLLKVAGDGLEYAVKEFAGGDLNENYDCIVIAGSTVPTSKVLKRQDILNVYQMGLLGNPQDPQLRAKVLKIMEFGDVGEMWKDQAIDEQQVKKVIAQIEDGQMPQPVGHEWDNHEMFIKRLNDYRKSDKFDNLSDAQKGYITMVAEWHVQALISLTNPSVQQNQVMAQNMINSMHQVQGPPGSPPPTQLPQHQSTMPQPGMPMGAA